MCSSRWGLSSLSFRNSSSFVTSHISRKSKFYFKDPAAHSAAQLYLVCNVSKDEMMNEINIVNLSFTVVDKDQIRMSTSLLCRYCMLLLLLSGELEDNYEINVWKRNANPALSRQIYIFNVFPPQFKHYKCVMVPRL